VGVESNGTVVLSGTSTAVPTKTIASWVQGNVYKGTHGKAHFTQGNVEAPMKPDRLLDSEGKIVGKAHPQYADHEVDDFVSVRDLGAIGDGVTDDTNALQAVFDKVRLSLTFQKNSDWPILIDLLLVLVVQDYLPGCRLLRRFIYTYHSSWDSPCR
jgi:hypothetical protein